MTSQEIREIANENYQLREENIKLTRIIADLTIQITDLKGLSNDNLSKILFCDFYKNWLENHKKVIQLNTYQEYKKVMDVHIYPYFKELGLLLDEIKAEDIQNYYNYKLTQGKVSPNTVLKHHANLYSCFKYAIKNHILSTNPMDNVIRPKK